MRRGLLRSMAVETEYSSSPYIFTLRKMDFYSGFCIEVERSSDSTKQNIGFVGDFLDTASLLTFVGAGDGIVTRMYNQGTDPEDLTATINNKIVVGGVLQTLNGKACIVISGGVSLGTLFDGVNKPYINTGYSEVFIGKTINSGRTINPLTGGTGYFHFFDSRGFRHNSTQILFTVTEDHVNQTISGSCWDLTSENIRFDYKGVDIGVLTGLNGQWAGGLAYGRSNITFQEHIIWDYNADDISTTKLGELCDLSNNFWLSY